MFKISLECNGLDKTPLAYSREILNVFNNP